MKKRIFAAFLCLALALPLAACRKEDDVAGADWRTDGTVLETIRITRDSVTQSVCVCVDENGVVLYHDDDTHTEYDRAAVPAGYEDAFKNARDGYGCVRSTDTNDDGYDDVLTIELTLEPSTETYLTWEWTPEDGYVYAPDYSYINEDITADGPDM